MHGSSALRVHAPALRLRRLYYKTSALRIKHACCGRLDAVLILSYPLFGSC